MGELIELNNFRDKPYCEGCDSRIQAGKAYVKKDIESAWYVVINIIHDRVAYRKMDIANNFNEPEISSEIVFTMPKDSFKYNFEFVSTIFCPYEINR